jgi:hypothetical protein
MTKTMHRVIQDLDPDLVYIFQSAVLWNQNYFFGYRLWKSFFGSGSGPGFESGSRCGPVQTNFSKVFQITIFCTQSRLLMLEVQHCCQEGCHLILGFFNHLTCVNPFYVGSGSKSGTETGFGMLSGTFPVPLRQKVPVPAVALPVPQQVLPIRITLSNKVFCFRFRRKF